MVEREKEIRTMKRTGSVVLALTAALTASSSLRESVYLSRYSCTDISSTNFFFFFHDLVIEMSSMLVVIVAIDIACFLRLRFSAASFVSRTVSH